MGEIHVKKIILIPTILLLSMTLAACGQSKTQSQTASSSQKSSSSLRVANNGSAITHDDYEKIQTGNVTGPKDGDAQSTILKAFGKPDSKSQVTVNSTNKKAAVQFAWKNVSDHFKASAVTVEFLNGHAIGKGYIEAGIHQRRYISTASINQVHKGNPYRQVLNVLGTPDAESVTGSGDLSARNLTYATGKDGRSISLMFAGDKLTSKTATVVK
ncbi:hypothetical protein HMPREF9103_02925 [Lentilactobacillus parafarraginis F0439]|uniref:DUF3862 domain-containing protein n=1 Tax=Lentilactobacillus parafarraginis F0439 TaxID=797515 RepID=G9ZT08_9LACO|nr:hypothetical protein HMPREF9103_02925 [Lentilactobacillus parafarraginis F0439]